MAPSNKQAKSDYKLGADHAMGRLAATMERLGLLWNAVQAIGIDNEDQKWLIEIVSRMIEMDYEGARCALMFLLACQGYRSMGIWEYSSSTVVDVRDLRIKGAGEYMKIYLEFDVQRGPRPGFPLGDQTIETYKLVYVASLNEITVF